MKNKNSFATQVIEIVRLIPEGRVSTYGAIARFIGTTGSARTVGYILGKSIEGRESPAHRVVNSVGVLSGAMAFETPTKMQELLESEGVIIEKSKVKNFKQLLWDPSIEMNG